MTEISKGWCGIALLALAFWGIALLPDDDPAQAKTNHAVTKTAATKPAQSEIRLGTFWLKSSESDREFLKGSGLSQAVVKMSGKRVRRAFYATGTSPWQLKNGKRTVVLIKKDGIYMLRPAKSATQLVKNIDDILAPTSAPSK